MCGLGFSRQCGHGQGALAAPHCPRRQGFVGLLWMEAIAAPYFAGEIHALLIYMLQNAFGVQLLL